MKYHKVAFATHAYWKDWEIVTHPKRLTVTIESHRYPFTQKILVINNIHNHQRSKLERRIKEVLHRGIVTDVVYSQEYLTDDVLEYFNIDPDFFWSHNPYFSTAQLTALHFAIQSGKSDYLLHMAGDVWLQKSGTWITRAISALESVKSDMHLAGFNLCRNIYQKKYPIWADTENDNFWISKERNGLQPFETHRGWGLSDLAYFLPLDRIFNFEFGTKELENYSPQWPRYARPCFEMYFRSWLDKNAYAYGALKPKSDVPLTKHKNYSNSPWKNRFYLSMGYYTRGKYSPQN